MQWSLEQKNAMMRLKALLLILAFLTISRADVVSVSDTGMTVLKAVYGASCGAGVAVVDEESLVTDYLKALCDGSDVCSGIIDGDVVRQGVKNSCSGDFHVVAVCSSGEIRSFSVEGEAAGEEFLLNCTIRYIPDFRQHPDWMGMMDDVIVNKTIKELKLPGTHHSGTSSFNMLLYHLAKCQNIPVGQQLLAGVRYLDYRIGSIDDTYGARVVHGMFFGNLFFGDLLQIWAFSQLHPRELFIVDLQNTRTLTRRMRRQLTVWLHALFHESSIQRWSTNLVEYTMDEAWSTGRRILFLQDDPISYLVWTRNVLYSRWPNVCSGDTLPDHADTLVSELPSLRNKLVVLQWLITVQFRCLSSLYDRSLMIREQMMDWLDNNDHSFTIVLTDFALQPLDEEGFVEFMIESNRL